MEYELKIIGKRNNPFRGDDGEERDYYWYKALRTGDFVTIDFGSKNDYEIGETHKLTLEKREAKKGYRYVEVYSN